MNKADELIIRVLMSLTLGFLFAGIAYAIPALIAGTPSLSWMYQMGAVLFFTTFWYSVSAKNAYQKLNRSK